MAKIRKIKERELIGGTSEVEVYPITHTEAIYGSNGVKLSDSLKEISEYMKKTVYLTEAEYDTLKAQGAIKDDVEYNIFEEYEEI